MNDKERIPKGAREKKWYRSDPFLLIAKLLSRNVKSQEESDMRILQKKICQQKMLYPAKLSFRNEGKHDVSILRDRQYTKMQSVISKVHDMGSTEHREEVFLLYFLNFCWCLLSL